MGQSHPSTPEQRAQYTGPHELHTEVSQNRVDYRHENILHSRLQSLTFTHISSDHGGKRDARWTPESSS